MGQLTEAEARERDRARDDDPGVVYVATYEVEVDQPGFYTWEVVGCYSTRAAAESAIAELVERMAPVQEWKGFNTIPYRIDDAPKLGVGVVSRMV